MCVEVIIDDDFIMSIGQLRDKIGQEPVYAEGMAYLIDSNPHPNDDECLCPIDLDATAALIGRTCEWKDDWFYQFSPAPTSAALSGHTEKGGE